MTAKLLPDDGSDEVRADLDPYDQQLMTAVVERAEKAGKKVKPLIVPTNNPLHAILKLAQELNAQEVILGASNKYAADVQLEQIALYWMNLHEGEPLILSARLAPGRSVPRLILGGSTLDGMQHLEAVADGPAVADSGVAIRWGRAKVEALLDTLHDGATPDSVRAAVIDVSKAYGIVTPYTSLVAVEEFPTATGESSRVRVANGLPAGSGHPGDLPHGGTHEPILFLVGMLLALAGTVLLVGALRLPGKA